MGIPRRYQQKMKDRILHALKQRWEGIADDVLSGMCKGILEAEDIRCIVGDKFTDSYTIDKDIVSEWNGLTWEEQELLLQEAFPTSESW